MDQLFRTANPKLINVDHNFLHRFAGYNYTIVLRALSLKKLQETYTNAARQQYPMSWGDYEDTSISLTLAATGGVYSFKNRYPTEKYTQYSDVFIESLTLDYPVGLDGATGIDGDGQLPNNMILTLREPKGVDFFNNFLWIYEQF